MSADHTTKQTCDWCGTDNPGSAERCSRCNQSLQLAATMVDRPSPREGRRWGPSRLDGVVGTQPAAGEHRPPHVILGAATVVVLLICFLLNGPTLAISRSINAVVYLLMLILLPVLPLLVLGMLIFRRPIGGTFAMFALRFAVRAAVIVARSAMTLIKSLVAPRPSVTFDVAINAGPTRQVRLLQSAPGLIYGTPVHVRGLLIAGVMYATAVRTSTTHVTLRPRTQVTTIATLFLMATAAYSVLGTFIL